MDTYISNIQNNWTTVKNRRSKKRTKNCNSDNYKKALCKNMMSNKICEYKKTCCYAHSYEEQIVIGKRKEAYDIIKNNYNLDYIDLHKDKELYEELLKLTNVCTKCLINECFGGYNCRDGVFTEKYQVCRNDLIKGFCNNTCCEKIHLTNRGLVPYENYNIKNYKLPNVILINDKYFEKEKLLSKKVKLFNNDNNSDISDDNISISSFINFDNTQDLELLRKSIFEIDFTYLMC